MPSYWIRQAICAAATQIRLKRKNKKTKDRKSKGTTLYLVCLRVRCDAFLYTYYQYV